MIASLPLPLRWAIWPLLLGLEGLYGFLVMLRLGLFRIGLKRTYRLPRPAVAVGNLTSGGTGKTPIVSWLLTEAASLGIPVACLSRGYGRHTLAALSRVRASEGTPLDPGTVGDEIAMLASAHPGVPFLVGVDRVEAARLAMVTDAPALLVLDDAYQHLRVERELNVLLVDAQAGFGSGHLLPVGDLREPLRQARRADIVLITKANLGDPGAIAMRLRALGVTVPIFRCEYQATRLARLDSRPTLPPATLPGHALAGRQVGLLCGIARPEGFRATITALGANVIHVEARSDHYAYPEDDLAHLDRLLADGPKGAAASEGPDWITTEKDAVKLRGRLGVPERLWVLAMEAVPEPAARAFFLDRLRTLTVK